METHHAVDSVSDQGWVQSNHGLDAIPPGWSHFENRDDDDDNVDVCKDGWPCASGLFCFTRDA